MQLWQTLFWAALSIVLIIAEIVTVQLVSIWFAAGSLAAFIGSFFGIDFYWQIIIFIIVSVICLAATRPFVKKITKKDHTKTNVDALIGEECIVKEKVDNLNGTGRVILKGLDWAAQSEDNSVIEEGTVCRVLSISGVKVIIKAVKRA